jgi:hypothetical protein
MYWTSEDKSNYLVFILKYTCSLYHNSLLTVYRQILAIVLIWRVEKITKLKRRNHFPFHCKTYNFTKFGNFEQ